jgi:long-chain acyl-CoA synthetase
MFVHDFISQTAYKTPDKIALITSDRQFSFREIDENSDRLAAELQRLGVARGDRVAAMLDNSAEMVIALWATLKAGGAFVPLNHTAKSGTLGFILSDAEPKCLIIHPLFGRRLEEAAASASSSMAVIWTEDAVSTRQETTAPSRQESTSPNGTRLSLADILARPHQRPADPGLIDQDLSLIIYTSGSTGKPKGVMMPHHAICNNVWSVSTYLRNTPDDVILCVLPLSFDYGLFQILTGARVGFTIVLERSFAYPIDVLQKVSKHGVTGFPGVPTIFARLLQFTPFDGLDFSSLRYFSNTAAAFPPAHIRQLKELLPHVTIFSMYGVTETTRVSYLAPEKLDAKITSVGRAMPNSETYIVDENGLPLGHGEVGELVVRGSSLMRGYWRRPDETARVLRDCPFMNGEKAFHTGDLFWADADGDLYFVGRRDDVFKCRGEKVSPKEVENALYELDAIAETAVIGVPDPIDGLAVKACIVLREGRQLSEEALRRHCRTRLEPWLQPKFFEFLDSLPKTDSGKITRHPLRDALKKAAKAAE